MILWNFNISTFLTIHGIILTSISLLPLPTQGDVTKIDTELKKKIDSAPSGSTWTVIIEFKKDQAIFDDIYEYVENLKPPPGEKGMKAYESMTRLEKYAEETQGRVIQAITNFQKTHPKVTQSTFWISNDRGVWNAPKDLLYLLGEDRTRDFKNITKIVENSLIPLEESETDHKPVPNPEEADSGSYAAGEYEPLKETWGIAQINARKWWKKNYNGSGVIIGHIDTGADSRHPSLKFNWLGKPYGWLDPSPEGREVNTFPWEATKGAAHGTHTLGIAIGRGRKKTNLIMTPGETNKDLKEKDIEFFGVGVAPGARWISCQGCPATICDKTYLHECGKFIACPDPKTKCRLIPEIVTISNGYPQNERVQASNKTFPFQLMIRMFKAVGMIPVFAAGNEGLEGCQTIREPENKEIISVGNVDALDRLYPTSSKGPPKWRYSDQEIGRDNIYKPDLIAPGTNIYSTIFTGKKADFEYDYRTGTSASAPHVAGAIALMLSRTEFLTYEQVRAILLNYTKPNRDLISSTPKREKCGGKTDMDQPNHKFGWGRLRLPDPDVLDTLGYIEQRPTRKMPPPPDYSTLDDDSAPHSVRAGMVGVVLMAGMAFLMNFVLPI